MIRLFLIFFLLPLSVFAHSADESEKISVDLARDNIAITTGFNGAEIELYGVKDLPGDVVVVVKGPQRDMEVRKKGKIMGGWMNKQSLTFKNIPSYYAYAANKPLDEITSADILSSFEVGAHNIQFDTEVNVPDKQKKSFVDALLRNKKKLNLIDNQPRDISFLSDRFFKVSFTFPHNVPVGVYDVSVYYFIDGEVFDHSYKTLKVEQVGLSSRLYVFAKTEPFIYGLLCVFLAIFTGWLSNRLKRAI